VKVSKSSNQVFDNLPFPIFQFLPPPQVFFVISNHSAQIDTAPRPTSTSRAPSTTSSASTSPPTSSANPTGAPSYSSAKQHIYNVKYISHISLLEFPLNVKVLHFAYLG
jgi:hypothetical protein